jgi:hypothetical protein
MRRTPRLLGVLPGPRVPRLAVPARGSPRTAGPSETPHRRRASPAGPSETPHRRRASRGSRATAASPSSPRRHWRGLTYKNRLPHPPCAVTAAPPCLPLPTTGELASPSLSSAPNLPNLLPRCPRNLRRHPLLVIAPPPPELQPAAATTAGHRRTPSPESSLLEPRSSPHPK